MHINEVLIDGVEQDLRQYYGIYINESWDLLKKPIRNIKDFYLRRDASLKIIKDILTKHGKQDILKFLSGLALLESKIQILEPWVRDHVVHAINTFILGVYIIKSIRLPKILDYQFIWKISGATHDLGYPLEISNNITTSFTEELEKILKELDPSSIKLKIPCYPEGLNKLYNDIDANNQIQKRLDDWELGISVIDYYKWLENKNKVDHGVISALAQMKVMDSIYQKNNPERARKRIEIDGLDYNQKFFENDITDASSAIFIHNIDLKYPGMNKKINFKKAPIAFLLYLCDNIQDWDRYSRIKKKIYSGEGFNIECDNNTVNLFTPEILRDGLIEKLSTRLEGLTIRVNGETVAE